MSAVLEYEKFLYDYDYSYEDNKFSGLWAKLDGLRYNSDKVTGLVDKEGGPIGCDYSVYVFDDYAEEDNIDKAVNDDIEALFESLDGEVNYNNIYVLPEVFEAIKDSGLLTDFNIFEYDYRKKMITINKPWIPDDFDINDYIPEEPEEPEFTPKTVYFISYNDNAGTTEYARGSVETTNITKDGKTKVKVLTNTIEEWINLEFYVNSNAEEDDNNYYQLFKLENDILTAIDVWVKLFSTEQEEPEEPVGTEYVTPRIMDGEGANDINNFDIGYQLSSNINISSPLIYSIEFTGHAEQGLTLGAAEYLMGTPFGYKFDEIDNIGYYSMNYCPQSDGDPKIKIVLGDNNNSIELYYTISSELFTDFNIEEDHTYKMTLVQDTSDVQTTGIIHVVPSLNIDDNILTPDNREPEYSSTLDFNISGDIQDFVDWINNFQTHIYLFGCIQGANWGEFDVAEIPFEISNVTVYYTAGGDISQLDPGQTLGEWALDAISYNTLNDGDNDYTLTPMVNLVL